MLVCFSDMFRQSRAQTTCNNIQFNLSTALFNFTPVIDGLTQLFPGAYDNSALFFRLEGGDWYPSRVSQKQKSQQMFIKI